MKKILIINPYYYPGYKSGGPQQTIMNIVDILGDIYNFHILTSDKDMGDTESYPNIKHRTWNKVGKAKVYYHDGSNFSMSFLKNFINHFELVYLCGPYYDFAYKTLLLNRLGRITAKVVLAPMGSFGPGAIRSKRIKKFIFWEAEKHLGFFLNITWSLTSEIELHEMTTVIGKQKKCIIAQDLPRRFVNYHGIRNFNKSKGTIRIVFLSRISSHKNLYMAAKIVSQLKYNVTFDIYGTKEEPAYWAECEQILKDAPANIHWSYKGTVKPEKVVDIFSQYHCFLFPTKSENFGHVIYEALMGGCVPIISDATPWQNFEEKKCGYVLNRSKENEFIDALSCIADMDEKTFKEMSTCAMQYAEQFYLKSIDNTGYRKIF